jgi:hypothetical protein
MERVVGSEFTSKRIFEKIISKTFEISNYLQVFRPCLLRELSLTTLRGQQNFVNM